MPIALGIKLRFEMKKEMDEEKIQLLAIIFEAMKEAVASLENAQKEQNTEKIFSAKKEILKFQNEISKIIVKT